MKDKILFLLFKAVFVLQGETEHFLYNEIEVYFKKQEKRTWVWE